MPTTGAKFPTVGTSVSSGRANEVPWSGPGNIVSDNATSATDTTRTAYITAATFDTPDPSYWLVAQGFDFSAIPDGSTINGVVATIEAWNTSGLTGSIDTAQLLDTSGAPVGTNQYAGANQALNVTTTQTWVKGSSSDLWGNALTWQWVKNANFGVAYGMHATSQNADVYVDYITLEVYFTNPVIMSPAAAAAAGTGANLALTHSMITTVARLGLATSVPPVSRTGHSLQFRARVQTAASATLRAALYDGSTNRSGDLESSPLTTTLALYSLPISDVNAAAITSYELLELRVWGYSAAGDTPTLEIAEAWLQTPFATPPTTMELTCSASSATSTGAATTVTVAPILPCAAASATAGGHSLLLGSFLDAASGAATGGTMPVTVAVTMPCAASSGAAATRNAILGSFLDTNTATATGRSMLLGMFPAAASAHTTGGNTVLELVPILVCTSSSATASSRNAILGAFFDASSAQASGGTVAVIVRPLLPCAANSAQAGGGTATVAVAVKIVAATASATASGANAALSTSTVTFLPFDAAAATALGSPIVQLAATATPYFHVALPGGTPYLRTGHVLHIRGRAQTPVTAIFRAVLYENAIARTGILESATLSTDIATYDLAISDGVAASIVDYSALTVRIWAYSSTNDTTTIEVEDVALETPRTPEPVPLTCAGNSGNASTRNVLLSRWLNAAAAQASGDSFGVQTPPIISEPGQLILYGGQAAASGRNALLGLFLEIAHAQSSAIPVVLAAALAPSPASAHATGSTVTSLNLPGVPVLPCAASSAVASGSVTLIVPPQLQCVATLTATGRSVLLSSFLNASVVRASGTAVLLAAVGTPPLPASLLGVLQLGTVELAVVGATPELSCAPAQATASGRNVLLGRFLDIAHGQASGNLTLTAAAPMQWSAASARAVTGRRLLLGPATFLGPTTFLGGQPLTLSTLTVPVLPCAANSAQATATVRLIVPPKLTCITAAAASGQNVLLGRFLDPNFARATTGGLVLIGWLAAAPATAQAVGRSVLLGSFLDPAAGAASGATTVTVAPILQPDACSATASGENIAVQIPGFVALNLAIAIGAADGTVLLSRTEPVEPAASSAAAAGQLTMSFWMDAASAVATADEIALTIIPVPVLEFAAGSAAAAGTLILRVQPFLACTATATAMGRSMLLASFLDAASVAASLSGTLTTAVRLSAAASAAQASGRQLLLSSFLDAASGAATGIVRIIVRPLLPLDAAAGAGTGDALSLQVPGIAQLGLQSSDAAASGAATVSRPEPLEPAECTATAAGRVTMSSWLDAATATSDATVSNLYTVPILQLGTAEMAATATANLRSFWRWQSDATATGRPVLLGMWLRPASMAGTATARIGVRFSPITTGGGIIVRPTVGRIATFTNGRIENREEHALRHHV